MHILLPWQRRLLVFCCFFFSKTCSATGTEVSLSAFSQRNASNWCKHLCTCQAQPPREWNSLGNFCGIIKSVFCGRNVTARTYVGLMRFLYFIFCIETLSCVKTHSNVLAMSTSLYVCLLATWLFMFSICFQFKFSGLKKKKKKVVLETNAVTKVSFMVW